MYNLGLRDSCTYSVRMYHFVSSVYIIGTPILLCSSRTSMNRRASQYESEDKCKETQTIAQRVHPLEGISPQWSTPLACPGKSSLLQTVSRVPPCAGSRGGGLAGKKIKRSLVQKGAQSPTGWVGCREEKRGAGSKKDAKKLPAWESNPALTRPDQLNDRGVFYRYTSKKIRYSDA